MLFCHGLFGDALAFVSRQGRWRGSMGLPGTAFLRWWQAKKALLGAHGSTLELAAALFEAERSFEHAETLAMALAAVGRFADAAELQRSLVAQLPAEVDPGLRGRLVENLGRYERGEGPL